MHPDPPVRFMRMDEVERAIGLKKRTIQNMVNDKTFPSPVTLHERSIAFVESEVAAWMQACIDRRET